MNHSHRSHRIGLGWLLMPGVVAIALSIFVDVLRGGDLVADWGAGQTGLFLFGLTLCLFGWIVHRKAVGTERHGGRPYRRTIAFILTPTLTLLLVPLLVGETVCRLLPAPDDSGTSYRQSDRRFGFSIEPNRQYHIISRPKAFDITVRIGSDGFRKSPNETNVTVTNADIVVMGDSHPFGFGVSEHETLPVQLQRSLQDDGHPTKVLNAGIPGFGLGQSLLLMRSLDQLREGCVIVLFVNPLNDMVNTSSAVDYHYPKPHAVVDNGELMFREAPTGWGRGAFLFSEPFDSLNSFFQIGDEARFYHSALLSRLNHFATQHPTVAGVTELIDNTSPEQFLLDDDTRIENAPLLYASRFWPAMNRFDHERSVLKELTTAIFAEMNRTATKSQWHLLVVVAPEAFQIQTYGQRFYQKVQQTLPKETFQSGWSRNAVIDALQKAQVDFIVPEYQTQPSDGSTIDSFFVVNDDHTSAKGHQVIATMASQFIQKNQWLAAP